MKDQSLHNKIDKLADKIDKVILKLVEHDSRFDEITRNMATKDDINGLLTNMDHLVRKSNWKH